MAATTERGKIVVQAIKDFPDADKRTLARHLKDKYPHEFSSLEVARTAVRHYSGQSGERSKAVADKHGTQREPGQPHTITIPKGIRQCKRPKKFSGKGRYLVISDLHVPYHNEAAVVAAIRHGVDTGCENVVINGDAVDFYKLSRWSQNPEYRNPDKELDLLGEILDEISRHFPGLKIYKIGNHEERYETYLYQRAAGLATIPRFKLKNVLLDGRPWEYVDGRQHYSIGRLPLFHGHELPKGLASPVNVARGVYLRVQESAIVGHWHKTSTHIETSGLKSRTTACYSQGCLCDLTPEYATVNSWNHGFCVVTVGEGNTIEVWNRTIDRGNVYATE